MGYQGEHRDNTARPKCQCGKHDHNPLAHADDCPVNVEARARLCIGKGGTR